MKYPWLDAYLLRKPEVTKDFKQEWGWYRYQVGDKLFCAVCLDDRGEKPYYITLKLAPARGDALRQLFPDILPGYYMNKTHWNSVRADGGVPESVLREMLDEAYTLVLGGLSKKKQQEILKQNISEEKNETV